MALRNRRLCGGRHVIPFAVHTVLGEVLGLDRLEGASAHMQGDLGLRYTHGAQGVEQRLVKVQGGGGCCHSAGVFGKHGLIARSILWGVGVRDVRRQRHMAIPLQQGVRVLTLVIAENKTKQCAIGVWPAPQQSGAQASSAMEFDGAAHFRLFAHPHVRCDLVAAQHPFDQQFDPPARRFFPKQAGLDHPRVVEHQQIAGAQQAGQCVEHPVHRAAARAVKQPGRCSLVCRLLSDQALWQIEIKVGECEAARRQPLAAGRMGQSLNGTTTCRCSPRPSMPRAMTSPFFR